MLERPKALLFISNPNKLGIFAAIVEKNGYDVVTAASWDVVQRQIEKSDFVIGVVESFSNLESGFRNLPKKRTKWIVVSQDSALSDREALRKSGVVQVLKSTGDEKDLERAIKHIEKCFNDPFLDLMDTLEFITGVQLVKEKRNLVESRLSRRLLELGISNFVDYVEYFKAHLDSELTQAISLITTHTTEFFREERHFDFLFESVYPRIVDGQKSISIWSAAASTGQEVYSLAISILEYLEMRGIPAGKRPTIRILGTDIDSACLALAREGIYSVDQITSLSPQIVKKYFDVGTGELKGFVRVKDFVHQLCHFDRINLLGDTLNISDMDFIFLRNTMIYFKPSDIEIIMRKLSHVLRPQGFLFLGHSESLLNLSTPFDGVGQSIYKLKNSGVSMVSRLPSTKVPTMEMMVAENQRLNSEKTDQSNEALILIGASTGGVEALERVLENFPLGSPPVLIVQHIPKMFSYTLAKRLNEVCAIEVLEASGGEILKKSHAYIAPGGKQMRVVNIKGSLRIEINDDPPVGPHKPSVDYLFKSAVNLLSSKQPQKMSLAAALLTGMGSDGAQGLKDLRDAGAYTAAQNKKTSVVFGMPAVAIELGAAQDVLPLSHISSALLKHSKHQRQLKTGA